MTNRDPRVAFISTGLFRGGAEAMLYKLLRAMPDDAARALVVSLGAPAPFADDISALGVPVVSLGFRPSCPSIAPLLQMRRAVARFQPDVLQGWMYHGNLAALVARPLVSPTTPVLWSIRQTISDLGNEKRLTARIVTVGARLSGRAHRIIYNSRTSAAQHEALGYNADRTIVIPNGFDTESIRLDDLTRARARRSLGITEATVVVGLVARYHPMKDHAGFIRAAAQLLREGLDVVFVLVGREVSAKHPVIGAALSASGLTGAPRIRLMSEMSPTEIAALTPAFDIACSASAWGDAFPNVLGEAMAAGVPCVTTSVGDAAWIVGETGLVVPPSDPDAMAAAIRSLVVAGADRRRTLGAQARARVEREFDINTVARRYREVFVDAAHASGARRGLVSAP
ncbi:MAG: glycosyltransferase [Gemmatimonadaceae bacterium]